MFSYDSLSRLISATNPETGTVNYKYLNSDNATFCAGDVSLPCSKTDARNVITTYSYDFLGRLTSKTYSGQSAAATPSSCYQYDNASNGVGRLGAEWTIFGNCSATLPASGYLTSRLILNYDPVGRIKREQQCHGSSCTPYTTVTDYNLAGNPISISSFPIAIKQNYDSAGRLLSIDSSWSDMAHPGRLFSVGSRYSFGAIQQMTLGTNINVNRNYDNRFRPTSQTATHP